MLSILINAYACSPNMAEGHGNRNKQEVSAIFFKQKSIIYALSSKSKIE